MERERIREAKLLWEQWGHYLEAKDEDSFFRFLHQFVEYFSRSHSDDKDMEISQLPDSLLKEIKEYLKNQTYEKLPGMSSKRRTNSITAIRCLSTLARNLRNIPLLSSLSIIESIYKLMDLQNSCESHPETLNPMLEEFLLFLERLYDPFSKWKHRNASSTQTEVHQTCKAAALDMHVIKLICDGCKIEKLDYGMKTKLIDLLGNIISGSAVEPSNVQPGGPEGNAAIIICTPVMDTLDAMIYADSMTVLKLPTGLRRSILALYVVMVHRLHAENPNARKLEVSEIVDRYLNAVTHLRHEHTEYFLSHAELLFDTLNRMVHGQKDLEALKASFKSIKFCERVISLVDDMNVDDENENLLKLKLPLAKAFTQCLRVFLHNSRVMKSSWSESVGYDRLLLVLLNLGQPDKLLLLRYCDMVVEKDYKPRERQSIVNVDVLSMLLNWLPLITDQPDQLWLAQAVRDVACSSEKNKMICCDSGLILVSMKCVQQLCQQNRPITTGKVMSLIERLGSFSITAAEMKFLISLLQLPNIPDMTDFTKRVLQSVTYMTDKQKAVKNRPLCYFSLSNSKSLIRLLDDLHCREHFRNGFTFHTWLRLDNNSAFKNFRRIIYSFQCSNGGFEAFINDLGELVIAVLNTNESRFDAFEVPHAQLTDGQWHMLDIVYTMDGGGPLMGKLCDWKVYIDGAHKIRCRLNPYRCNGRMCYSLGGPVPSTDGLSRPSSSNTVTAAGAGLSRIGHALRGLRLPGKKKEPVESNPGTMRFDLGQEDMQCGFPTSIHGEIGAICLFKKDIGEDVISTLFFKGANNMEMSGLVRSECFLYLHAKMCEGVKCIDISGNEKEGTLKEGHTCISHTITDMIKCIGGFEVFIPHLERIGKEEVSSSKLFESDISFDSSTQNNVSSFLHLFKSYIQDSDAGINEDQIELCNCVPVIGAILQKVNSSLIDEYTLMAVQNLVNAAKPETSQTFSELYESLLYYIVFDFKIWSRAENTVTKVGHAQFLREMVNESKSDLDEYKHRFGVQVILDGIRQCYSNEQNQEGDDLSFVREALFTIIKLYVGKSINMDDLQCILLFIHTVENMRVVLEALNLLYDLLKICRTDQIYLHMYALNAGPRLYQLLVTRNPILKNIKTTIPDRNIPREVKLTILQIILTLLKKRAGTDMGNLMLTDYMGGLITQMTPHLTNDDHLFSSLMKIVCTPGVTPNPEDLVSVLSLSGNCRIPTKLVMAETLSDALKTFPDLLTRLVGAKGWQEALSCILKNIPVNTTTQASSPDQDDSYVLVDHDGMSMQDISLNQYPTPTDTSDGPTKDGKSTTGDLLVGPEPLLGNADTVPQAACSDDKFGPLRQDAPDQQQQDRQSLSSADPSDGHTSLSSSQPSIEFGLEEDGDLSKPGVLMSDDNMSKPKELSAEAHGNDVFMDKPAPLRGMDYSSSPLLTLRPPGSTSRQSSTLTMSSIVETELYARISTSELDENRHECSDHCATCLDKLYEVMLDLHCQLIWKGLYGDAEAIWKGRHMVFHSLRNQEKPLIIDKIVYMREILEYMLARCCEVVHDHTPARVEDYTNGQKLINLVCDFIKKYSVVSPAALSETLIDKSIDLLDRMTVWNSETAWPEVARTGLEILMVFFCCGNDVLCSRASTKMDHLIRDETVLMSENEIGYIIYKVHAWVINSHGAANHAAMNIIQIIRAILNRHSRLLDIPFAVKLSEDLAIFYSKQWQEYVDDQIKENHDFCITLMKHNVQEMMNLWNEIEDDYNSYWHHHRRRTGDCKLHFRNHITEPLVQAIDREQQRYGIYKLEQVQAFRQHMAEWKAKMRFLTSQRGPWAASGTDNDTHWKISSHENFFRMRMKMVPNDMFDDHLDASRARDNQDYEPSGNRNLDVRISSQYEASSDITDDDEDLANTGAVEVDIDPTDILMIVECQLICLMDPIPGKLRITAETLSFYDPNPAARDGIGQSFDCPMVDVKRIHYRLRNLQKTALEFFRKDQTNYFLNFKTSAERKTVVRCIKGAKKRDPEFKIHGGAQGALVLRFAGITRDWERREISNFEYLIHLNTIAGRTYNDWSQYPVFPWVLKDYNSDKLDLKNPESYRDFTKPAGAMNAPIEAELQSRYKHLEETCTEHDEIKPFHHGTHYSSAAGVVTHFLIRIEPFTTKHIDLQTGRFDCADRLFFSIEGSFKSVLTSLNDCKELTPDFFCLPEFLVNMNGFDLGRQIGDVELPKWVEGRTRDDLTSRMKRADDFIWKHRKALESDYVSSQLHHWIDLIFGYKQRGPAAVEACNMYQAYSYDGQYDLSRMAEKQREQMEKTISEFGQTPIQLLTDDGHRARWTQEQCEKDALSAMRPVNVLPYLETGKLRSFRVRVHERSQDRTGRIVLIAIPTSVAKPIIGAGLDTLVTISDRGFIGVHKWQAADNNITDKFVFNKDLAVDQGTKRLTGPLLPGKTFIPKLLAVSVDGESVFSGGYWDNSLRVYSLTDQHHKVINAHYGVVTCLHLDSSGKLLVTGSADTTCKIWSVTGLNENSKPVQCLYGHDDEVICVAISTEYDMVASGSKDGTVNIHTVSKGLFMQSLLIPHRLPDSTLTVHEIIITWLGQIIVYCEEYSITSTQTAKSMLRYSLNGFLLDNKVIVAHHTITQMASAQDYLVYGTEEGRIYLLEIHRLRSLHSIPIQKPIRCLSFAYMNKKYSHILVGCEEQDPDKPSLMIVLGRNADPHFPHFPFAPLNKLGLK